MHHPFQTSRKGTFSPLNGGEQIEMKGGVEPNQYCEVQAGGDRCVQAHEPGGKVERKVET